MHTVGGTPARICPQETNVGVPVSNPFKHAVVVGSGMAGLTTSRVLADHFERVTLLERDAAPDGAGPRPGVPQGKHFHALLPGGLRILTVLFPSLLDELKRAGSLLPAPGQFY